MIATLKTNTARAFVEKNPKLADTDESQLIVMHYSALLERAVIFATASANMRDRDLWESELASINAAKSNAVRLAVSDLIHAGLVLEDATREAEQISDRVPALIEKHLKHRGAASASRT